MRRAAAYAALAASFAVAACDAAPRTEGPTSAPAVTANKVKLTSFTFTKIPAPFATHAITSPVTGLETIVFQMDATQASGMIVKQFGFMIAGSLQVGDVGNYQLVYYPQGLNKPAVVIGTNDGSTWVAPGGSSLLYFDLTTPITIPKGKTFTAFFGLRADVTGTGTFFFYPRVQTCLVDDGTGARDVAWFGGDLPLQGDQYNVN